MREEIEKRYRKKQLICVILGVCIALILTGSIVNRRMKVVDAKVRRRSWPGKYSVFTCLPTVTVKRTRR